MLLDHRGSFRGKRSDLSFGTEPLLTRRSGSQDDTTTVGGLFGTLVDSEESM